MMECGQIQPKCQLLRIQAISPVHLNPFIEWSIATTPKKSVALLNLAKSDNGYYKLLAASHSAIPSRK